MKKIGVQHIRVVPLLAAMVLVAACSSGVNGARTDPGVGYTIGGTVAGLATGENIAVQNNGGDDLIITEDGPFTFATTIADGNAYFVTVLMQPAGKICTASANTGTVTGANVTSVSVVCASAAYTVGGTLAGLDAGKTVVLQNNGADDLTLTANGPFIFASKIADGAGYNVAVKTDPAGQVCVMNGSSGTVASANIEDISVNCVAATASGGVWDQMIWDQDGWQ